MNKQDNYPDLSDRGYKVIRQLGNDRAASYFTWQGIVLNSNITVAIEQFRFATKDSSWVGYEAYQQEIELLKKLDYPGIPKYLNSFETDNSFYFVREYIEGISLAQQTEITEKKLKIIAVKALDILIYLQRQHPPILYLNITPNNILLDDKLNVYLIDFRLARSVNTELKPNYVKMDNAEFIAPEQFKSPCQASDIYSLGQTLISVIDRQKLPTLNSHNNLNCEDNKSFLSTLDSGFQEWLNTAIEPDLTKRYSDAEQALKALQISSWDDINSEPNLFENLSLSQQQFSLGIAAMTSLGFAIALGFDITQKVTEKSFINITITLMGMVIIYLTQSASATIITNDRTEQKQAISVAISVPIILAIVTGIIFGKGEAVAMSLSAIVAQTATLGYVLFQKLPLTQPENILRGIALLIAIAFGLIGGAIL